MSEEEQRVIYSSSFLFGKSPLESMEALKIRQTQMRTVNLELAKFLTDYGHLRLKYLSGVKNLVESNSDLFSSLSSAKLQNSKIDALGLTAPLWHELYNSLETEAKLGDEGVRRMGAEVIAPLKTFFRNHDSNLIEMDDLITLAGNIDKAEKSNKDATVLRNEWSQRAPYFFEIFEDYDYKRLLLLKEVFIKFETDRGNVLSAFRKSNETSLEHALNFVPTEEIERFSKDAMSKTLPIELIKPVQEIKPKAAPSAEFTSSSNDQHHHHRSLLPKRKSKVLSPPSNGSSHDDRRATSVSTQASSGSTLSTISEVPKKEKSKLRSRFGSVLRGGRKKKDKHDSVAAIPESETSSIASGPSSYSARNGSSSALSSGGNVADARAALSSNSSKPKTPSTADETSSSAYTHPDATQTQASSVSEPPSYPSMQPTKRSDSIGNDNATPSSSGEHPVPVEEPVAKDVHVPEPVVASAPVSAPHPPNARKHISTVDEPSNVPYPVSQMENMSIKNSTHHGSAPPPVPAQRRSMNLQAVPERVPSQSVSSTVEPLSAMGTGSSGYLQQQVTGAGNALQRNTTGGGSLTSGQVQHPPLTQPGLNASIVELFNATYKDGALIRSNAVGEVAFSYIISDQITKIPSRIELKVESAENGKLPSFMINPIFLEQTGESEYAITDASQIHLRTSGGMKYMLTDPVSPISVHPIWKHEPNQSTVIIALKPIPQLAEYLAANPNQSITLNNLLVSVAIADASSTTAATKPAGSFNREKNRVNWNLYNSPIVFSSANPEQRLIARFTTDGLASEAASGVQLRFTINHENGGDAICGLNSSFKLTTIDERAVDPFGSYENVEEWKEVPTLKTVVAGTYTGHA